MWSEPSTVSAVGWTQKDQSSTWSSADHWRGFADLCPPPSAVILWLWLVPPSPPARVNLPGSTHFSHHSCASQPSPAKPLREWLSSPLIRWLSELGQRSLFSLEFSLTWTQQEAEATVLSSAAFGRWWDACWETTSSLCIWGQGESRMPQGVAFGVPVGDCPLRYRSRVLSPPWVTPATFASHFCDSLP